MIALVLALLMPLDALWGWYLRLDRGRRIARGCNCGAPGCGVCMRWVR